MWQARKRREECTRFLVGKPEGNKPLGRPRHRWEDGIRMDLGKIFWGGDSIGSVSCCECDEQPSGSGATKSVT
jgi:hypothetical protein